MSPKPSSEVVKNTSVNDFKKSNSDGPVSAHVIIDAKGNKIISVSDLGACWIYNLSGEVIRKYNLLKTKTGVFA